LVVDLQDVVSILLLEMAVKMIQSKVVSSQHLSLPTSDHFFVHCFKENILNGGEVINLAVVSLQLEVAV